MPTIESYERDGILISSRVAGNRNEDLEVNVTDRELVIRESEGRERTRRTRRRRTTAIARSPMALSSAG